MSLHTSVVRDADGRALYGISQFEDISDRRAERQELTRRARIDPLTGLLNRSALVERVQEAVTAARRTQRPGAVLFCDLDAFKPVNDTLGHAFGDQVLAIIARRLESQVRAGDTTARFGGDEFVIVTDGLADDELDDLVGPAAGLPSRRRSTSHGTSVSPVGHGRPGAGHGTGGETAEGLVAAADVDMYLRKPGARDTEQPAAALAGRSLAAGTKPVAHPALDQDRQVGRHVGRRRARRAPRRSRGRRLRRPRAH